MTSGICDHQDAIQRRAALALFVSPGYTIGIEGMPEHEAQTLLTGGYQGHRRLLHRITVGEFETAPTPPAN